MEAILSSMMWLIFALAYVGLVCLVARCMGINRL